MKKNMNYGILYLLPASLGGDGTDMILPEGVKEIICSLNIFIVENLRTARRFLRLAGYTASLDDEHFFVLDKHTPEASLLHFLSPLKEGKNIGLLSEAGMPCIADPGSLIVEQAHIIGAEVRPMVGPSSILLALVASGMNGQNFCFHGYLPVDRKPLIDKIRIMEKHSVWQTQAFMETPYRNKRLLETILQQCSPETKLCIAADLTMPTEFIRTMPVGRWKNSVPDLHKRPAIFLIGK